LSSKDNKLQNVQEKWSISIQFKHESLSEASLSTVVLAQKSNVTEDMNLT
jgi:hypothetical protein